MLDLTTPYYFKQMKKVEKNQTYPEYLKLGFLKGLAVLKRREHAKTVIELTHADLHPAACPCKGPSSRD